MNSKLKVFIKILIISFLIGGICRLTCVIFFRDYVDKYGFWVNLFTAMITTYIAMSTTNFVQVFINKNESHKVKND